MDLIGTILIMSAIVCYLLALQYGGATKPWHSSTVVGLFTGFFLILIAFACWQVLQGQRAVITPSLIRPRIVWLNCLYAFFFAGSFYVLVYYLPIYFQSVAGVSPTISGIRNLPLLLATSVFISISGIVMSVTGTTTLITIPAAAVAALGAGLLYTLDIGSAADKWISYQIIGGIGYGLGFQVPILAVQGSVNPQDLAASTAIVLCM